MTNDQQINGSDVENNLVDSILYDIRSGFPHKKSFDKVWRVMRSKKSFYIFRYTFRVKDHIMQQL